MSTASAPLGLTVSHCLRVPPLVQATVVAGRSGLDVRHVRWLAVIEWPVEHFVAPDELVLTTGIGCDARRFAQLVREVADSGAAGLCVAVGEGAPFAHIPADARSVADDRSMPLMEIPWSMRFAEILRAVVDRLLWKRYATVLDTRDQLPADFIDALLDRDGLRAIAESLEAMIARGVLVLDVALAAVAHGPIAEARLGADALAAQPALVHGLEPGRLAALFEQVCGNDVSQAAAIPDAGLPGGLWAPAIARDTTVGYVLALEDDADRAPLLVERQAIDHAAVAVAIETLRRHAAAEAEARVRGDFLWELASGAVASPHEVTAKAMLLGYAVDRRYRIALAEAHHDGAEGLDEVAAHLRRQGAGVGIQVSRLGNRVLALFPDDVPPALAPRELVRRLSARASTSWGIADGTFSLATLADGARAAERALRVGRALHGPGAVGDASALGPFLLLESIADDASALEAAAAVLAPLERYDRESARDLVHTLDVFLQENGNTSAAARRLFLNRHSLTYRLRKIEALSGRDVERHEDRFLLDLCLRLRRLQRPL